MSQEELATEYLKVLGLGLKIAYARIDELEQQIKEIKQWHEEEDVKDEEGRSGS